jgi:hypothetical protein
MNDAQLVKILEIIEQRLPSWKGKDLLHRLIEIESDRLRDAAQMMGLTWNGRFSTAHVELVARAYQETVRQVARKGSGSAAQGRF